MEAHFYNVNLVWNQERRGTMCSPELALANPHSTCIDVATPPEFTKGMAGVWSPEHLFTASVVSCFMTTFLAIAENSKLEFKSFTCDSSGKLDMQEGKLQMTEIILYPVVGIMQETERERALRVLVKTENACLITNSIKASINIQSKIRVE